MLLLPPHFTGSVEQRKKDDLLDGFETGRSLQMQCRGRGWKEGFARAGPETRSPENSPPLTGSDSVPHATKLTTPRAPVRTGRMQARSGPAPWDSQLG